MKTKKLPVIKFLIPLTAFLFSINFAFAYDLVSNNNITNLLTTIPSNTIVLSTSTETLNYYDNGSNVGGHMADYGPYDATGMTWGDFLTGRTTVQLVLLDNTNPSFSADELLDYNDAILSASFIASATYFYNNPLLASVFTWTDRTVSNNSGTGLSSNVVPAVSNLWPIMLIIIGLVLVFYIIEKIIKTVNQNLSISKKRKKVI